MSFQPPLRPEQKPKGPQSWYQELMEHDELLLYITATMGVLLPGIVYLIYQRVHAVYQKYAARKESERIKEEAARCKVAIIQVGESGGASSRFRKNLEANLVPELSTTPKVWTVEEMTASQLAEFKGMCIFLIDTVNGAPSDSSQWFLEWLEDVAADSKQKKKTHFDTIRFVIAAFGDSRDGEAKFNKAGKTLQKRLKILGSRSMMPIALLDTGLQEADLNNLFSAWLDALFDAIDNNVPGARDSEDSAGSQSDSDSNRTDTSDTEPEDYDFSDRRRLITQSRKTKIK